MIRIRPNLTLHIGSTECKVSNFELPLLATHADLAHRFSTSPPFNEPGYYYVPILPDGTYGPGSTPLLSTLGSLGDTIELLRVPIDEKPGDYEIQPDAFSGFADFNAKELVEWIESNFEISDQILLLVHDKHSRDISPEVTIRDYLNFANSDPLNSKSSYNAVYIDFERVSDAEIAVGPGIMLSFDMKYIMDTQNATSGTAVEVESAVFEYLRQFVKQSKSGLYLPEDFTNLFDSFPLVDWSNAKTLKDDELINEISSKLAKVKEDWLKTSKFVSRTLNMNAAEVLAERYAAKSKDQEIKVLEKKIEDLGPVLKMWNFWAKTRRVFLNSLFYELIVAFAYALILSFYGDKSIYCYIGLALLWLYFLHSLISFIFPQRVENFQLNMLNAITPVAYPKKIDLNVKFWDHITRKVLNKEEIDYDAEVKKFIIKPTIPQIAILYVLTLRKEVYKAWKKNVEMNKAAGIKVIKEFVESMEDTLAQNNPDTSSTLRTTISVNQPGAVAQAFLGTETETENGTATEIEIEIETETENERGTQTENLNNDTIEELNETSNEHLNEHQSENANANENNSDSSEEDDQHEFH